MASKLTSEDQALLASLPQPKVVDAGALVNGWLDSDEDAPFDPIVQAVLDMTGQTEPAEEAVLQD